MGVVLYFTDGGGSQTIAHDLNFAQERYENSHILVWNTQILNVLILQTFKNPKPNLLRALAQSGPAESLERAQTPASKEKRKLDIDDKRGKKNKTEKRPVRISALTLSPNALGGIRATGRRLAET